MISKDEFEFIVSKTFEEINSLTSSKGEEYSRSNDQLANFRRGAENNEITMHKVLSIYLSKHMDAIQSWINNGVELSEPIEGRINDAILYLILLKAMVYETKRDNPLPGSAVLTDNKYGFVVGENE